MLHQNQYFSAEIQLIKSTGANAEVQTLLYKMKDLLDGKFFDVVLQTHVLTISAHVYVGTIPIVETTACLPRLF